MMRTLRYLFLLLKRKYWPRDAQSAGVLTRFVRNFSLSAGGSAANILIGVARTALLTKTLPVESYGRILIVVDLFRFVKMFVDVRVSDVLYKYLPAFEESNSETAAKGLLVLGLTICAVLGGVVAGGIFFTSEWIAKSFYEDANLSSGFRIYAAGVVFAAFSGFYRPILRLRDRFSLLIVPQVLGQFVTLVFLGVYLLGVGGRQFNLIIAAFAGGMLIRSLVPLVAALRLSAPHLSGWWKLRDEWKALSPYRQELVATLWQTNLAGYLKLGSQQGGGFLLGVLSTPRQVALYGIARQLARPLKVLQNNVQTAIAPEIFTLHAESEMSKLYSFTKGFLKAKAVVGGMALVAAFFLARPAVLLIAQPEYLEAVPVFWAMVSVTFVTFVTLTLYPLTVAMGKLTRRNLCMGARFVYIGGAATLGLDAFKMAVAQFAGALTTAAGADVPTFLQLKHAAKAGRGRVQEQDDAKDDSSRERSETESTRKVR
jgi:O-antigen/teichoic acid export membrane protein